jgi:glycosyltransferase involved in cell wall biosynthesis
MNGARLDIAMPFYGDVELMKEAVASVRAQTDADWRLLVVDDGSPEPVAQWFHTLDDPRVEYHRNAENLGIAANFQRCLELSSADLVTFMGCDDRMLPDYVRLARKAFSSPISEDVAVWHPGVVVIDGYGSRVTPLADLVKWVLRPQSHGSSRLSGQQLVTRLMHGNWTYFPAMCWRRKAISDFGFSQDVSVVQDIELLVDVAVAGWSVLLDSTNAFEYRRHAGSVSSRERSGIRFAEESTLFRQLAEQFEAIGWTRAARAARWRITSRLHHWLARRNS